MASVEKFSDVAVYNQIRHNARKIEHPSNKDILPELSHLNYSLLPERDGMEAYRYYSERMSQLYVLQRDDVKPLAGWVVTLPKEITDAEEQRRFFECAFDFLSARYGEQNVVQAVVHYDEGVRHKLRDDGGNPVYDESGKRILLKFSNTRKMSSSMSSESSSAPTGPRARTPSMRKNCGTSSPSSTGRVRSTWICIPTTSSPARN